LKDEAEITLLQDGIGKKPMLFMCLNGNCKDGQVCVSPVKDQFYRAFSWKRYRASAELLQSSSGIATEQAATSLCCWL